MIKVDEERVLHIIYEPGDLTRYDFIASSCYTRDMVRMSCNNNFVCNTHELIIYDVLEFIKRNGAPPDTKRLYEEYANKTILDYHVQYIMSATNTRSPYTALAIILMVWYIIVNDDHYTYLVLDGREDWMRGNKIKSLYDLVNKRSK